MIVQLGWRVIFAFSMCLSCASSAVQAANTDVQAANSEVQAANSEVEEKSKPAETVPILPTVLPPVSPPILPSKVNPDPASATLPIKYWGNSFSLKFHRPFCPFAKAMSAHHVMFFNFRRQAVESGQVPCRYCLPPNWTTVRASLWHPAELYKTDTSMPEPNPESVNAPALPTQVSN